MTLEVVLRILAAGALGYLVGSFSSGYLVGKVYRNVDLRSVGSGSTGATNTFRVLGPGAALLVVVVDIAKGALAVFLAQLLAPGAGTDAQRAAQALAAIGAVGGHCWPLTLEGRGGRGIATGVGALLFVASPAVIFAVLFFGVAIVLTRIVSVASLSSVLGALVGYVVLTWAGAIPFHWAPLAYILVGGLIIYLRHAENIRRLLTGREPRLGDPFSSR